jgi:hypothetical protein
MTKICALDLLAKCQYTCPTLTKQERSVADSTSEPRDEKRCIVNEILRVSAVDIHMDDSVSQLTLTLEGASGPSLHPTDCVLYFYSLDELNAVATQLEMAISLWEFKRPQDVNQG